MAARRRANTVSRREFVAGGAGLTFLFTLGDGMTARLGAATREVPTIAIDGWITIGTDNSITIAAPAAEMGQGVFTALPMLVAEELDADWYRVKAVIAPTEPRFGNPLFGGTLLTVGSRSIAGYFDKARMQGAQARRVLMQAVAERWNVPLAELGTEPSIVIHLPSRRRIKYGEIAKFAQVPAELPKVTAADLKKPVDFRIIGKDVNRLDIPSKVDGSAVYGIDVQVPDMVYATMLRAPVEGAALDSVDDAEALRVPGVTGTVKLKDAVGILGERVEAVLAAKNLLKVTWKGGATAGYDSDKAIEEFTRRARNLDDKGAYFLNTGDVDAALKRAHKVLRAEFQSDYVYHAQLEPMNITASISEAGDEADIWVGTQAQTAYAAVAARFLNTKPEKIRIHQHMLGGGFGRRGSPDLVPYVLALAKEAKKPVKLIWTREQDVKAAKNRPMTAHFLEAGFDELGGVVAWRHRIVGEAVTAYGRPDALGSKGIDPVTLSGAGHNYEFANQSIEYLREQRGAALGAWHSTGAGYNKFAIEAFVDELARAWGEDPVVFRLKRMQKHPRGRRVLESVAQMASWGTQPVEGRAFGAAYVDVHGTAAAGIAEVSVDAASGVIRVHNFWNAINPGIVVNPDGVVSQCEGNVVFGLSQTLKERISFADGAVVQSNFSDYEVLRLSEVPEIHTQVISTDDPPTGVGEIVLPLVAPAVANAVFALTGKRLRRLPFTPDRVKAALSA